MFMAKEIRRSSWCHVRKVAPFVSISRTQEHLEVVEMLVQRRLIKAISSWGTGGPLQPADANSP